MNRENFEIKFKIIENEIKEIKFCKKIDDEKIMIKVPNYLMIINIIDNIDYMIIQKYSLSCEYYDFNSKLDLIFINEGGYSNSIYFNSYSGKINNYNSSYMTEVSYKGKLQFINNDSFFHFCYGNLTLYQLKEGNK